MLATEAQQATYLEQQKLAADASKRPQELDVRGELASHDDEDEADSLLQQSSLPASPSPPPSSAQLLGAPTPDGSSKGAGASHNSSTSNSSSSSSSNDSGNSYGAATKPIKCSALHTLERDMPDFDYSHLVRELRQRFLEFAADNEGMFSGSDLDKCRQDDWYLSRFLLRQKLNVDASLEMLKRTLRFKHESLANSIRAQDFPAEFYKIGGLFAYECDRKGNRMLYIRVRVHKKIPEISLVIQAFLYHQIMALDEQVDGKGMVICFDCSGGGLANADMDMLMFLVTTLFNYFPKGLSYFLVHELPWILKPFWHIAKAWISEEHRRLIQFSDSKSIFEYVERENLPDFLGGTCTKSYREPPPECVSLEQAGKLWGVEKKVVERILAKFAQWLPDEDQTALEASATDEDDDDEFQDSSEHQAPAKQ